MSLYRYRIQCGCMSDIEFLEMEKSIDSVSNDGLQWNPASHVGEFFLVSEDDLALVHLPDGCICIRIN